MKKLPILFFFCFTSLFAFKNQLAAQRSSYKEAMASVIFADSAGTLHSLGDIIEQQKGKVVYLDFWATWCMPCLQSMPAAKDLAQNLNTFPITFIYIALDDNAETWQKIIAKQDIGAAANRLHYRAPRRQAEPVLAAFYAHAIPHYVIFDKNGRLVAPHATSPAEKITENKLRKLAKAKVK